MNSENLVRLKVLQQESSMLKTKIMPKDSVYIWTAISVINDRIKELERKLTPEEKTWYALNTNYHGPWWRTV